MSKEKWWVDGAVVGSTLQEHVLAQRGLARADFDVAWPDSLYDPFLMPDMEAAVARIWKAIVAKETIGIMGDYDMDGTPAAALLAHFFSLFSIDPKVILPRREDGYGFSPAFVEQFLKQGTSLIITVDCGIRDYAAALKAKEAGCDVIITDHHECAETLPEAIAIINPKRPDSNYPCKHLSGTGVIFKVIQALILRATPEYKKRIPETWLAWSLDLVGLATIADMVDLVDENRLFAIYGLKVIQKGGRPGLNRLITGLGLDRSLLTYSDLSFKIISTLNASGRMQDMYDVFTLLSSTDREEIDNAIKAILVRGTQSQLLLASMLEQAKGRVPTEDQNKIIILADDAWHPGLTGLVAGRLVEQYKVPVGVFAGVGNGEYRGSMRSIPGVDLPVVLNQVSEHLMKFGGHSQAAGLSFERTKFETLKAALAGLDVTGDGAHAFTTEGLITADMVNLESLESLLELAPWGMGNKEPFWSLQGVTLEDGRWLSDGKHYKATVRGESGSLPCIFFGAEAYKDSIDALLDIYGTLSINEYRGKKTPQFMIKGVAVSK